MHFITNTWLLTLLMTVKVGRVSQCWFTFFFGGGGDDYILKSEVICLFINVSEEHKIVI